MAVKKSRDAKFQLHVWSKLLEGRIALQKLVVASRDWERATCDKLDATAEERRPADEATIKSVSKLLTCLVRLRGTYRSRSQLNDKAHLDDMAIEDVESDEHDDSSTHEDDNKDGDSHIEPKMVVKDELLDRQHNKFAPTRTKIIDKWCEKTKIGTIPRKGYTALELPTVQLIESALKDKDRLVRRTQLDRSKHDEQRHPEVFNDDDFYHQLLKEVISKDEGRRWVELQRTRYKQKRSADTRATKGRKIKKDIITKLVNFMAPTSAPPQRNGSSREDAMPEQIRNELMRSLFGGSVGVNT